MHKTIVLFSLILALLLTGCEYRKGTAFTWKETGDSVRYIVIATGHGKALSEKVKKLTLEHESRGDTCQTILLSGPPENDMSRQILLFNSALPHLNDDMLSKGFMGTFATKQKITYLVVSEKDIEKFLVPVKRPKK